MTLKEAVTRAGNEADLVNVGSWAQTFIFSLEENGFVIVPKEATKEMLAACLPCADTDYTEADKRLGAAGCLLLSGARNIPREGEAVYAAAGLARDYRVLLAARPKLDDAK